MTSLRFDEDAFLNVILRDPEDIEVEGVKEEAEIQEDISEEDCELIYDQDYEFEDL